MSIFNPPLRIGAPYLNARPLVWQFLREPSPELILVEDVPTRLAARVRSGELDAALLSSIEAYRNTDLEVLTDIGVASRGPVWSIKLFHQKPLADVRTVALDASSYTSAALTRILLREKYGNEPEFVNAPPDLDAMLATCDAGLLIGDPGLRANHATVPFVDLGAEWFEWTGLPFVFAVWAARPGLLDAGLAKHLHAALDFGEKRIEEIVETESGPRNVSPEVCRDYLTRIIRYRLGEEEQHGLARFLQLAGVR